MTDWYASLGALIPLCLWIGIGFAIGRTEYITHRYYLWYRTFIFKLAMPLFIGANMMRADMSLNFNPGYYLGHFSAVFMALALVAFMGARWFGRRHPDYYVLGFSSSQANIVLIGLVLVSFTLGDAAAVPVGLLLAANFPVNLTVTSLLVHGNRHVTHIHAIAVTVGQSLLKALKDPIICGVLSGLGLNFIGFTPSLTLIGFLDSFSSVIIPLALVLIGLTVGRVGLVIDKELMAYAAVKLALQPCIVFLLGRYVFGLDDIWLQVGVIFAAAPTGINAITFAAHHGDVYDRVCQLFTFTTLASLFTYLFWFWVIGL